jgi:tRNA 2-thiouridine synthesizing protein A
MSIVDCRGLACPEPVITTQKALDHLQGEEIVVIVDHVFSCNNVERFARSRGYSVEVKQEDETFYLHIRKEKAEDKRESVREEGKVRKIVVYLNSHLLGRGDEALGSFLMKAFLKTLVELERRPERLILINSGVQLASEDSKVLEILKALSERRVEIVCCGTCIDFYGLKDRIGVGVISNMHDILQSLLEADHVIRP